MSVKNGMRPVHPGEILREELEELGLNANLMAKAMELMEREEANSLAGNRNTHTAQPVAV